MVFGKNCILWEFDYLLPHTRNFSSVITTVLKFEIESNFSFANVIRNGSASEVSDREALKRPTLIIHGIYYFL